MRLAAFITILLPAMLHGQIVLPSCFSDDMVLQRDVPIPVWGWAPTGEKINVTLAGQSRSTSADASRTWRVELDALPAGGPHDLVIAGTEAVTFKTVLIGDVWLCAGQSNMQHPMSQVIDADTEIAAANHPRIRLATVPMILATSEQDDIASLRWTTCQPATVKDFSAVAYYFGRQIHERLDIPIGLIDCSWYGTSINAWTSRRAYESHDEIRPILDQLDPSAMKDSSPTGIYNAMVAPLTRVPIKGVIWYQGESDARVASRYARHLPILIDDWRSAWKQDFPFLFVQIAWCKWWGEDWAAQCEAQTRVWQTVPKTGMVVICDQHDNFDQHPRTKKPVGERLALAARAVDYGERDVVYAGPTYRSVEFDGNRARVRFDHTGGSLAARIDGALSGFTVAGEDRKFVPAQAKIDGDTLLVWSDAVPRPVAVRYNWKISEPICGLYSAHDLPMGPFRTDDWPLP